MPSVGVKVTDWSAVPRAGVVEGVVKAKVPSTLAAPPLNVESARLSPTKMMLAVGGVVIVGVALLTVTLTVLWAVL